MENPNNYTELMDKLIKVKDTLNNLRIDNCNLFKGNNFITPNFIGYYKYKNQYIELSWGTGIVSKYLYGITIKNNNGKTQDNSYCSNDIGDLIFIKVLKG